MSGGELMMKISQMNQSSAQQQQDQLQQQQQLQQVVDLYPKKFSTERDGTTQLPVSLSGRSDEKPQRSLLPAFESAEMRTLAESLSRNIIHGNPDVKWESIKGLENAKRLLKEAVVMSIKYPNATHCVIP
ncbi:uncharacterized protein LOC131255550 isoform X2 [Magnolia sinica]|uniref:uncharacterized protein LOC131255550 isoform X2 n=1 Tax=Magnolia sinica TaxID=86752 RepID=UPI002659E70D|nr:uncharacterized protein LOC131255550 isoform X2 [Magnolia sinica]